MSVSDTSGSSRVSKPLAGAGAPSEPARATTPANTPSGNKNGSVGMVTIFEPFTDPLQRAIDNLAPGLNGAYNDLDKVEKTIAWIKEVSDKLGQPLNSNTLMWEGPLKIAGWPTDVDGAIVATSKLIGQLIAKSVLLDASAFDASWYVNSSGQRVIINNAELSGEVFEYDPSQWAGVVGANEGQRAWEAIRHLKRSDAEWVRFPNGQIYHLEAGSDLPPGYLGGLVSFIKDPSLVSLALFGKQFLSETKRLQAAGLPIDSYDAYQYSYNGKTGYTTANQILDRASNDFSGIPNRTIVAVKGESGVDYYIVDFGKGLKLDSPPEGILMGLPSDLDPQAAKLLRDAIAATTDLVQNGFSFTPGDYDMVMYSYGGGQVGYAKMPPVVVTSNPQTVNVATTPTGTLLQYTDEQNKVSYYRVTGTGVIKVEDPSAIAKAVSGNPPDLSSIDPGTLVKLDDGKLYWVTSDQKTMPADGAPLLRYMSRERSANWHGVQVTALLEQAGYVPTDKEADTIRYRDKNDNTIFAKMPPKVFNGPGSEPNGKDYAPGDVIESVDHTGVGKKAWYIDEQGKVQEARSCVEVKVSGVKEKDFDPAKYNPGDVVGLDNGIYYRITMDQDKKQISYPLERLICDPSDAQIKLIKGQLIDLQSSKSANMTTLALRLQSIFGQSNNLATMMASIVKAIMQMLETFTRNSMV